MASHHQAAYLATFRFWLTILTLIYAAVFVVDCAIHASEGWALAVKERRDTLMAQHDCTNGDIKSEFLLDSCVHILNTPVPVPWQVAVHTAARRLSEKMASTLQTLVVVAVVGLLAFFWFLRNPTIYHDLVQLFGAIATTTSTTVNGNHRSDDVHRHDENDGTGAPGCRSRQQRPRSTIIQLPPEAAAAASARSQTRRRFGHS